MAPECNHGNVAFLPSYFLSFRNPSNCEKEAGSPRDSKVDRMCPRKRNSPRTDNVFARLQSVSSTASTGSSADTIPYEAGKLLPQHV